METDTHVYIATERVRPLEGTLLDSTMKGKAKEDWVGWGVRSIAVSLHKQQCAHDLTLVSRQQ